VPKLTRPHFRFLHKRHSSAEHRARLGIYRALAAGIATMLVAFLGGFGVGELSGVKAMHMLESMMPTVRFFVSAVMTAAATILALMLTLLSLSFNSRSRLKAVHYRRIQQIALIDCIAFITATLFMILLLVSVPLEQSGTLAQRWQDAVYWVVLGMTSILGGLLVGVVVMLFSALRDMIDALALNERSTLLAEPAEER
jgi:hypothetical protein